MSVQLAEAFSSLLVENEDLLAFYQRRYHFANYLGTFYGGQAYGYVTVFVYQEYFFKFYCCTCFCILDVVYKQFLASFCLELLAVDFYNCVHFLYIMYKLAPSGGLQSLGKLFVGPVSE